MQTCEKGTPAPVSTNRNLQSHLILNNGERARPFICGIFPSAFEDIIA